MLFCLENIDLLVRTMSIYRILFTVLSFVIVRCLKRYWSKWNSVERRCMLYIFEQIKWHDDNDDRGWSVWRNARIRPIFLQTFTMSNFGNVNHWRRHRTVSLEFLNRNWLQCINVDNTLSTKKVTPCIHCHNSDKQCQILADFWCNI